MKIRIGTRQSQLATWQAHWVADELRKLDVEVELVPIVTTGDVNSQAFGEVGGTGLFTLEIQKGLLEDRCDVAVHSLKDLPTVPDSRLVLCATPERADIRDGLISRSGVPFHDLPSGSVIGTGSPRRQSQLLAMRPDLKVVGIRGNVDTRISKLDRGDYDAIVLAMAGLIRLQLTHRVTEILGPPRFLPAVGQGALGLEIRADDRATAKYISSLNHAPTMQAVLAERSLLRELRAGCLAPVAALAVVNGSR